MNSINLSGGNLELFLELNEYGMNFKIFNILRASLKLGIYDYLKSKKSLNEISDYFGIKINKLDPFLNVLMELGYIKLVEDKYQNTEISEVFLTSDSFYSMKDYFFTMSRFSDMWYNLDTTLKEDIVFQDKDVFVNVVNGMGYECLLGELEKTIEIINKYPKFQNGKKALDLAGGHGLYAIGMEKSNPALQTYVFDLKKVLRNTQEFIDKFNSNVKTIPGDFNTDDLGFDYDIIFSSYNPGGKNPKIAEKIYSALNDGGLFITKQCFNGEEDNANLPEDLASKIGILEWNFSHLNNDNVKNKNLYSFKGDLSFNNYVEYLKKLGFLILDVYAEDEFSNKNSKKCNAYMIVAEKRK